MGLRLILITLISGMISACGYEVDPRTIWHNRQGVNKYQESSFVDSQNEFLEALGIDPFISEIHVNLGRTYQDLKQPENAIQSYESAEKWARNKEVLFAARFNQGVLRGLNKQVEEALQAYQRSLDVIPHSLEAKTNIELLIQQQQQQQQSQKGEGEDKKEGGEGQDKKDQKDPKEGQDPKDQKDKDQNKDKEKQYEKSKQYKPREFKGDLSEMDVKKILGELKQQEQKIRGQFYRNDTKEAPRDKDW